MSKKSFIEYIKTLKFIVYTELKYFFNRDDEKYIKKVFKKTHNYELNINNPLTIDEKISINKYKDNSVLKKQLSDKYTVREYVKNKGLSNILIEPFFVFNSTKDIDFSQFKFPVIVKCSNNSGNAYKYYPGDKIDKWKIKSLNLSLKQNYYHHLREKNYDGLNGKIIVEKILNPEKSLLIDYKFFCFNGEIGFVFIEQGVSTDSGSHNHNYRRNIVNENYEEIKNVKETRESIDMKFLPKPSNWEEMCFCAKKISEDLNFVRIDLYSVNNKTYFGEITFYHGSGNNKFEPREFDEYYAKKIEILS